MSNDTGSPTGHKKLEQIAASLERGENVESVTVRELLRWFGAERRGPQINQTIQAALAAQNLFTEPELNVEHLDGSLKFGQGLSRLNRIIDAKGPMKFTAGQPMSADQAEVANAIWEEAVRDLLSDWLDHHQSATPSEIQTQVDALVGLSVSVILDRHQSAMQSKIQTQVDALARLDLDVLVDNKTADIIAFPVVKPAPNQEHPPVAHDRPIKIKDATFRIGRLPCANNPPTCVAPNSSITEAMTIMMHNDFSQLPVMVGEREVKGAVSWRSIGARLSQGANLNGEVRDFMDKFHDMQRVLSVNETLLEAVNKIVKFEYILVINQEKKISGIVTLTDVSVIFRDLSRPFILLEEIENHVRNMIIRSDFSNNELQSARDPRDDKRHINRAADLTFGEYVRLLQLPESWKRLKLSIDRKYFLDHLNTIKDIRNEVMHFDPDGIPDKGLQRLEKFVDFLHGITTRPSGQ